MATTITFYILKRSFMHTPLMIPVGKNASAPYLVMFGNENDCAHVADAIREAMSGKATVDYLDIRNVARAGLGVRYSFVSFEDPHDGSVVEVFAVDNVSDDAGVAAHFAKHAEKVRLF